MNAANYKQNNLEVCILAGGLSTRMGRDKSRVRLGRRTMVGHIRAVAEQLGLRVRAIRRDSIPRSGPIGGIYTALQSSKADAVLFLACDMPFVSAKLLQRMIQTIPPHSKALFAREGRLAGFPCVLRRENCLPLVARQIERAEFSLQALAKVLKAKMIRPSRGDSGELDNINTPKDLKSAQQRMRSGASRKDEH